MNPQGAQNYLRTKVLTATPEQLQLMLFDGALRFADQARVALEQKNFEQSYKLLTSAQKIVNQLSIGLKRDVAPELCGNLAAIYAYAYRLLVKANLKHELAPLDEAVKLLKYQRETWVLLLQQLSSQKAGLEARQLDDPAPDERMEASISMQG
jgi:flagellar protein FliS